MIIQYKNRALIYMYMFTIILILYTVGIVVFNIHNNVLEYIGSLLFIALFMLYAGITQKQKGILAG